MEALDLPGELLRITNDREIPVNEISSAVCYPLVISKPIPEKAWFLQ